MVNVSVYGCVYGYKSVFTLFLLGSARTSQEDVLLMLDMVVLETVARSDGDGGRDGVVLVSVAVVVLLVVPVNAGFG